MESKGFESLPCLLAFFVLPSGRSHSLVSFNDSRMRLLRYFLEMMFDVEYTKVLCGNYGSNLENLCVTFGKLLTSLELSFLI